MATFTQNINEIGNILINSKTVAEAKRKAEAKGWTCKKIKYSGYDALDARKGLTVYKAYCNSTQRIAVWRTIQAVELSPTTPKGVFGGVKATTNRAPRVKTLSVADGKRYGISKYPNISTTGSIVGWRKQMGKYGKTALMVRCGSYIYNVSAAPRIYDAAH